MSETNQSLTLVREESVRTIVSRGPEVLSQNQASVANCTRAGEALLAAIQAGGMNEQLDEKARTYIEKARKTVKAMNERRSAITKIFDQIRTEFTTMENAVDPGKGGTIPNRIQQLRNEYAARRREEEERRRREEMLRQQREAALRSYGLAVEDNYKSQLNALISAAISTVTSIDATTTLDNYEPTLETLKATLAGIDQAAAEQIKNLRCTAVVPAGLTPDDCRNIQRTTLERLTPNFTEQYRFEVGNTLEDIIDRMPSKRTNLQRAAEADAAEAERIKVEMAAREAEEGRRREEERLQREREAEARRQLEAKNAEMDGLFAQATLSPVTYAPRTSVKLKIVPQSPDAFMQVVSMWWSREGQYLPLDELAKIFKRQLTYCEKLANDKEAPTEINHPSILYVEEVKAK